MRNVFMTIANNLVPLASVGGAIWLMSIEKTGWGWLVFIALLTSSITRTFISEQANPAKKG